MPGPRRSTALFVLAVIAVAVTSLSAVLRSTDRDEVYGMARVRLAHETVYAKQRQCASAACDGRLWLSRSADRCKPPDRAMDYTLPNDQLLYAVEGDTLVLVAGAHSIKEPTTGDWINMRFTPAAGATTDALPLHAIVFGERLPTRDVPTDRVSLNPCVRAFGHDWTPF